MWKSLIAIWAWIKWLLAALMPFKKGVALAPFMRWSIWIVVDVAFVVALYYLNNKVPFTRFLPDWPQWLQRLWGYDSRRLWLPVLGELLVLLGIVLYWFYLVWFSDPDESPFPDIDAAWQEALSALELAGIRLSKVPLFFVLGRPSSLETHLFEAAGIKLLVKQTPADLHAPLHVFAEREAVYVTCRDASVLGKLAGFLALEDLPVGATGLDEASVLNLDKTMRPGSREQIVIEMLRQEATTIRTRAMRREALGKPLGSHLLSDATEVSRYKARLAHLCRLIAQDRQPHCAANGILLLIPLAGTDTPAEAQLTAQACQEDLHIVRHEMKLDCPVISLLVDMEDLPGFAEFILRQKSTKELANRRGSGFPMATRLSREADLDQIRISLTWVCTTYLQDSVYRIFRCESPEAMEPSVLFAENARLLLLLDEMNERSEALNSIIAQAVAPEKGPLFRYSGCYLAATGEKGHQAFVSGVLQKLVREQSSVSWTEAALAEDAEARTWAGYYFLAACFLSMLWLALVIVLIVFSRPNA